MTKTILCAGAAMLLITSVAPAMPQKPVTEFSAAKKAKANHPRQARAAPSGRKIACTVLGCRPVPRGCTPVTGRDWWGNPTDYDDVVCR
jgi:hypothetical protein